MEGARIYASIPMDRTVVAALKDVRYREINILAQEVHTFYSWLFDNT